LQPQPALAAYCPQGLQVGLTFINFILMKIFFTSFTFVVFLFVVQQANAQGCVAVRATGCSGANNSTMLAKGQFEFQTNMRYFESFRHFVGDEEQHERLEEHTEVRIKSMSYDFGFNYGLGKYTFLNVAIPFVINDRSNNHYTDNNGVAQRFSVQGRGLSDVRASVYHWFMPPVMDKKIAILGGIGIKLPTGAPNQSDVFHAKSYKGGDSTYLRVVDQAIQPGDGGFGVSVEAQLNYQLAKGLTFYTTGYYLFNPQATSNVMRGTALSATDTVQNFLSICDQYMARAGFNYTVQGKNPLNISVGGRLEGIPSEDLIGSSNGRRRPGYVVSIEPSVGWQIGSNRISFSVPVAMYRNRTKSVWDKIDPNGERHGDAAFADYFISASFAHRFGGSTVYEVH